MYGALFRIKNGHGGVDHVEHLLWTQPVIPFHNLNKPSNNSTVTIFSFNFKISWPNTMEVDGNRAGNQESCL